MRSGAVSDSSRRLPLALLSIAPTLAIFLLCADKSLTALAFSPAASLASKGISAGDRSQRSASTLTAAKVLSLLAQGGSPANAGCIFPHLEATSFVDAPCERRRHHLRHSSRPKSAISTIVWGRKAPFVAGRSRRDLSRGASARIRTSRFRRFVAAIAAVLTVTVARAPPPAGAARLPPGASAGGSTISSSTAPHSAAKRKATTSVIIVAAAAGTVYGRGYVMDNKDGRSDSASGDVSGDTKKDRDGEAMFDNLMGGKGPDVKDSDMLAKPNKEEDAIESSKAKELAKANAKAEEVVEAKVREEEVAEAEAQAQAKQEEQANAEAMEEGRTRDENQRIAEEEERQKREEAQARAEAERFIQRQREQEAARLVAANEKAAEELERTKLLEAKKAEAEQKWIEERMDKAEAQAAIRQMNRSIQEARQQPKSPEEERMLQEKYASLPLQERAFSILLDLGMVSPTPDRDDPSKYTIKRVRPSPMTLIAYE